MYTSIFDDEHNLLAIIIRNFELSERVRFITKDSQNPQVALMSRPQGEYITPHVHLPIERKVFGTPEVLVVRSGKMRVDLFNASKMFVESHIMQDGDIIILFSGGHGFDILETTIMVELKQGPFKEGLDKERFALDDEMLSQIMSRQVD